MRRDGEEGIHVGPEIGRFELSSIFDAIDWTSVWKRYALFVLRRIPCSRGISPFSRVQRRPFFARLLFLLADLSWIDDR